MFDLLLGSFMVALQWHNLAVILLSTFIGLWIGAIPGLGPVMAMAILFPFTFSMEPLTALLMLASIHVAGCYGGSVSAILINVPGDPASAATTFDGYAFARQGKARVALGLSLAASFLGSLGGIAALVLVSRPLADVALKFGPPETFALAVLGLCVVAAVSRGSTLKGLVMACLGLAFGFVGFDAVLGFPRYTFGIIELEAKINFVPALIGLFAISELMLLMLSGKTIAETGSLSGRLIDGMRETLRHPLTVLRSMIIGIFVGIVPGIGAVTANFVAYMIEKRSARDPSRFGRGAPEGVIAPEAANNASVTAALIPTLTLGIPGSAGAAMLLVAIMIQGLRPGPMLFSGSGELVNAFFAGLLIGAVAFTAMALVLTRWFAIVTVIPASLLAPALLVISLIGAYAFDQNFMDIIYAVFFGLLGFAARQLGYPVIGLVMGMILGGMAETSFHQSLQISGGSYWILISHPLPAAIFTVCLIILFGPSLWARVRRPGRRKETEESI